MNILAMPAPRPGQPRLPLAFWITKLAVEARARLARRRPLPAFTADDFDFSGLAIDAPNWLAQLISRDS